MNKHLINISELSKKDINDIIELSKKVKKFEKIKIFENISWSTLEKIETNKYKLEGIFIAEDYVRIYPYKEVFSHLLGYISKPNEKELALPFISKMPNFSSKYLSSVSMSASMSSESFYTND